MGVVNIFELILLFFRIFFIIYYSFQVLNFFSFSCQFCFLKYVIDHKWLQFCVITIKQSYATRLVNLHLPLDLHLL